MRAISLKEHVHSLLRALREMASSHVKHDDVSSKRGKRTALYTTTTHYNALQHTTTHYNTPQHNTTTTTATKTTSVQQIRGEMAGSGAISPGSISKKTNPVNIHIMSCDKILFAQYHDTAGCEMW
jgi:hypothetical protein